MSFGVARRGYDPDQVDEVVAELGDEVLQLRSLVQELREREADLHAALDHAEYRAKEAMCRADELQADLESVASLTPDTPLTSTGDDRADPAAASPGVGHAPIAEPERPAGDPDVAAMVGEETVRIVEAARHAAVEIGVRAEQEADQVLTAAREQARLIRADAEAQLLQRTRDADDAVAERLLEAADAIKQAQARAEAILADAFEEGASAVLHARNEAAAQVVAGEEEARQLVDAATAARDELLAELIRRRKLLRRQVEQLEAGRVRLRSAYEVVEASLAGATDELDRTLDEARAAARAAAERADAERDQQLEDVVIALGADPVALLATSPSSSGPADDAHADAQPISDQADVAGVAGRSHASDDAGSRSSGSGAGADATVVPDLGDGTGDHQPIDIVADPTDAADLSEPAEPAADDVEVFEPAEPAGGDVERSEPGELVGGDAVPVLDAASPGPGPALGAVGGEDEPAASAAPGGVRSGRRAPDPVEFEGRWSSAVRVLPPGAETAPAASRHVSRRARSTASASDVFARLRSGESRQPSLFDAPAPGAAELGAPLVDRGAVLPAREVDLEVVWLERRDAALAPALRALRRRLKAALADDEDALLDAIGGSETLPARADQLHDAATRRRDLVAAVTPPLVTAGAAGASLVDGGSESDRTADAVGATEIHRAAAGLAQVITEPLEERLDRAFARYHKALAASPQEPAGPASDAAPAARADSAPIDALVSAVKSAYRARRGVQVQVPTEHTVLVVGHRGLIAAVVPGTPLRWVVASPAPGAGRSGASGSGRTPSTEPDAGLRSCPSCVAVADVGAGDLFGHGHRQPPTRPGCRCAVAPVSAVVPPRR